MPQHALTSGVGRHAPVSPDRMALSCRNLRTVDRVLAA